MDIRNIQTFVCVAELKSFTRSAQALNYVQSTVTMRIQQLEKELGFPVFDRIGKTISLTPLGQEFLLYANDILQTMEKVDTLGKIPDDIRGTLHVGILESLLFSTILEMVSTFKKRYKNVNIQFKMGQAADLQVWLKENRLDLVYLSGNLNIEPDLVCCYKREERLIFMANPECELAGKTAVTLEEIFQYPLIVTESSGICYGKLCELATAQNLILEPSLMVDSTIAVADLVCKGMGIAFLPEYSVRKQLNAGQLVEIKTNLAPQIYYSQILRHKNKWNVSYLEGFISLIQEVRPENNIKK